MTLARKQLGRLGEQLVGQALEKRGFHIIQRNVRTRQDELDLVARSDAALWFVEVKTRSSHTAPPELAERQRHRIRRAALRFLQQHPVVVEEVRIMVAWVVMADGEAHVEWLEDTGD